MEYFVLYLLGSGEKITTAFVIMGLSFAFLSVFFASIMSVENREKFIFPTKVVIASLTIAFIGILIPTEKSLQYMAAYYVGKQAVQSETVQKLTELVTLKLDEEIKKAKELNSNR